MIVIELMISFKLHKLFISYIVSVWYNMYNSNSKYFYQYMFLSQANKEMKKELINFF